MHKNLSPGADNSKIVAKASDGVSAVAIIVLLRCVRVEGGGDLQVYIALIKTTLAVHV